MSISFCSLNIEFSVTSSLFFSAFKSKQELAERPTAWELLPPLQRGEEFQKHEACPVISDRVYSSSINSLDGLDIPASCIMPQNAWSRLLPL